MTLHLALPFEAAVERLRFAIRTLPGILSAISEIDMSAPTPE